MERRITLANITRSRELNDQQGTDNQSYQNNTKILIYYVIHLTKKR